MRRVAVVGATLLALTACLPRGAAADERTTVKIALLDMSSVMGTSGRGMMDGPAMPGWWGPAQGGWMAPGMMGMGPGTMVPDAMRMGSAETGRGPPPRTGAPDGPSDSRP